MKQNSMEHLEPKIEEKKRKEILRKYQIPNQKLRRKERKSMPLKHQQVTKA